MDRRKRKLAFQSNGSYSLGAAVSTVGHIVTSVCTDKLDLDTPQGATVALVGQSGCGKSSIISLLQRFYDPTYGKIMINGRDLRSTNLKKYRSHIGVVTQNPVLFDDTIWGTITYGSPQATREQATRAARRANAHSFIRDFPDGYDTMVGEGGVQLSGGELQRIAIARAIVQKPVSKHRTMPRFRRSSPPSLKFTRLFEGLNQHMVSGHAVGCCEIAMQDFTLLQSTWNTG